jgi:hypothetical protein
LFSSIVDGASLRFERHTKAEQKKRAEQTTIDMSRIE